MIYLFLILNLVVVFGIIFGFLFFALRGAPYVPTKDINVKKMMALAEIKPGEKAVDLGSGDGRLVIALAQAGAEAHGYELDPFLVKLSRKKIKQAGLESKAFIHWGDFWKANFLEYQVVTVFGMSQFMWFLGRKLRKKMKPGSRIVSNAFRFPGWNFDKKDGYLYRYIV